MKRLRTLISIGITIAIFIIIFGKIDVNELKYHFLHINIRYFLISMILFLPIVFTNAERWRIILSKSCNINRKEAIKLTLSGLTFSAITPSRLGDLTKAYFIKDHLNLKRGFGSVFFEKSMDLFSLCVFSLAGVVLSGTLSRVSAPVLIFSLVTISIVSIFFVIDFSNIKFFNWILDFLSRKEKIGNVTTELHTFISEIKKDRRILFLIISSSLLLWFLNLIQIYFFFLCFAYFPDIELVLGLVPIAIMVGMIPITIAGMGTRDSALIVLFAGYAPSSLILGVGILCSLRYGILGLAGLPFVRGYLSKLTED